MLKSKHLLKALNKHLLKALNKLIFSEIEPKKRKNLVYVRTFLFVPFGHNPIIKKIADEMNSESKKRLLIHSKSEEISRHKGNRYGDRSIGTKYIDRSEYGGYSKYNAFGYNIALHGRHYRTTLADMIIEEHINRIVDIDSLINKNIYLIYMEICTGIARGYNEKYIMEYK